MLQHALTWSITEHLRSQVPEVTEVVWMYDGVMLTGRVKPFITVEQMMNTSELLAAGREDYEDVFRWQIGLRARDATERSRLQETVKSVLRQKNITLYDTRVFPPTEAGVFVIDVTSVTPIPSDSETNETDRHLVFFDVVVEVQRSHVDNIEFTQ